MSLLAAAAGSLCRFMPRSFALTDCAGRIGPRVVLYHHIADEENDLTRGLGVTTPPDWFARHLDRFTRDYHVIDLDTLLHGPMPRRPLLITFDDAYRSVLDVAAPMLRERGLPAAFFITPGCIDQRTLAFDNLLAFAINRFGMAAVEHAVTGRSGSCRSYYDLNFGHISRMSYTQRIELPAQIARTFGLDPAALAAESNLYLTTDDLPQLAAYNIEAANHTLNHVFCRGLTGEALAQEIDDAKTLLELWTGQQVRAFSFPYGHPNDATLAATRCLTDTGHTVAFLARNRANAPDERDATLRLLDRVVLDHQPDGRVFAELEWLSRMRRASDRQGNRLHDRESKR